MFLAGTRPASGTATLAALSLERQGSSRVERRNRRMCAAAANLIERVLPPSTPLRQWVLTFPFPWKPRLAQDGELLGRHTQIFVDSVQGFYVRRAALEGAMGAKTGAVTAVQRASSDMRLNPHLHTIALDGALSEQGDELVFSGLGHLKTSEVGRGAGAGGPENRPIGGVMPSRSPRAQSCTRPSAPRSSCHCMPPRVRRQGPGRSGRLESPEPVERPADR